MEMIGLAHKQPRVAVIGGGIAGLCVGQALRSHGVPVTIFERDVSPLVRGQGYRLTIQSVQPLRTCLPPKIFEFIHRTADVAPPNSGFSFVNSKLERVGRFSFGTDIRRYMLGQVDRQTLRQALLTGLEDSVKFGKAFKQYRSITQDDGRVHFVVEFDDGTSEEADFIVGADGTNSKVRRQLLGVATEPRDVGIHTVFGRAPLSAAQEKFPTMSEMLKTDALLMLGKNRLSFFCTNMKFPSSPNSVAQEMGLSVGECPDQDYVMWALITDQGNDFLLEAHNKMQDAASFHPEFRAMMDASDRSDCVFMTIRAAPTIEPWDARGVTLLGDAIHTMPPFGANGANTALKDVEVLVTELFSPTNAHLDFGARFKLYEKHMVEYSNKVVKASASNMNMALYEFPFRDTIMGGFSWIVNMLMKRSSRK